MDVEESNTGSPPLTNITPISKDMEESRPSTRTLTAGTFIYSDLIILQILKHTDRDGSISTTEQEQAFFMATKSHDESFTPNISSKSQSDVNRQKDLIKKVFKKYKYRVRVHDSRLWQLAQEMAQFDLVPPELAFELTFI